MFVSSENGHLFNVQLPFMETGGGTCTNFRFFNRSISKMCLTYDDNCLVTASVDGTLVIWSILNNEHRRADLDEKLGSFSDVLIPRKNLLDTLGTVSSLEERICQQSEEFEYQFKQKESAHQKQVEEIHKSYSDAIEQLKVAEEKKGVCLRFYLYLILPPQSRNHKLEKEHVEELNLITARNAEAEDAHQKKLLLMETEFHRKIIVEYDKNKELSASFHQLRDESNAKLRKTAGYLEDTIESMESDFKQQIDNRRERIQQLIEYNGSLKLEFAEYCRQERAEFERQLVRLRLDYEKRLLREQEVNSKWRSEAGVISKKFSQAMRESGKLKEEFIEVHEANSDLQAMLEENGQERTELVAEVQRRDQQLQEKERMVEGLVKRVGESEEEKRQLLEQVNVLQKKLTPKDKEIRRKSEELTSLTSELEALHRANMELERILSGTKQRHEVLVSQVKQNAIEAHGTKTQLTRVIADINLLNEFILKPEQLKMEVVKLFGK